MTERSRNSIRAWRLAVRNSDAIEVQLRRLPEFCNVLVVIPTLNEARYIRSVLLSLGSRFVEENCCIAILDGGSADGTLAVVNELASERENIITVSNPDKIQASAMNIAAAVALEFLPVVKYLVRLDAHAFYPKDFIERLVNSMDSCKSDSLVVPMETVGGSKIQNSASDLFNSRLGHGGAIHRSINSSRWVDHGHHAAFLLEAYVENAGYDEGFKANEDEEFDYRLIKRGGRIYLDSDLVIGYVPRDGYWATARQYLRNGFYRAKNLHKHKRLPRLRQLAPFALLPVIILVELMALAIDARLAWLPGAYFVALLIASALIGKSKSVPHICRIWVLALASQLSFSVGGLLYLSTAMRIKKGEGRR